MMNKKNNVADWIVENMLNNIETITGKWNNGQTNKQDIVNISLCYRNGISNNAYTGFNPFQCWVHSTAYGFTNNVYYTPLQAKKLGLILKEEFKSDKVNNKYHYTMLTFYKKLNFKDKKTDEKITIPLLRYFTVYNIDQYVDNDAKKKQIEKHAENKKPVIVNEIGKIEAIEKVISNYIINQPTLDLRITKKPGYPSYSPTNDIISIPDIKFFKTNIAYYESLIHESVHSTGNVKRLKRPMHGMNNKSEYAIEELIAEFGVAYLSEKINVEYDAKNILLYIKGWLSALKSNPNQLIKAAAKSSKAVNYIMGDIT